MPLPPMCPSLYPKTLKFSSFSGYAVVHWTFIHDSQAWLKHSNNFCSGKVEKRDMGFKLWLIQYIISNLRLWLNSFVFWLKKLSWIILKWAAIFSISILNKISFCFCLFVYLCAFALYVRTFIYPIGGHFFVSIKQSFLQNWWEFVSLLIASMWKTSKN